MRPQSSPLPYTRLDFAIGSERFGSRVAPFYSAVGQLAESSTFRDSSRRKWGRTLGERARRWQPMSVELAPTRCSRSSNDVRAPRSPLADPPRRLLRVRARFPFTPPPGRRRPFPRERAPRRVVIRCERAGRVCDAASAAREDDERGCRRRRRAGGKGANWA